MREGDFYGAKKTLLASAFMLSTSWIAQARGFFRAITKALSTQAYVSSWPMP